MILRPLLRLLPVLWSLRVALHPKPNTNCKETAMEPNSFTTDVQPSLRPPRQLYTTSFTSILNQSSDASSSQNKIISRLIQQKSFMVCMRTTANLDANLQLHNLSDSCGPINTVHPTCFNLYEYVLQRMIKTVCQCKTAQELMNCVLVIFAGFLFTTITTWSLIRKSKICKKKFERLCLNQSQVKTEKMKNAQIRDRSIAVHHDRPTENGKLLKLFQESRVLKEEPKTENTLSTYNLSSSDLKQNKLEKQFIMQRNRNTSDTNKLIKKGSDIISIKINRELKKSWMIRAINTQTLLFLVAYHMLDKYPSTVTFIYVADFAWIANSQTSFFDLVLKKLHHKRHRRSREVCQRSRFYLNFFLFGMISAYNSSSRRTERVTRSQLEMRFQENRSYFSFRTSPFGKRGVRIISRLFSGFTAKTSNPESHKLHECAVD